MTWLDLESIMLSEISQRQTLYAFPYMQNLTKQTNKQKQKQTPRYREQTTGCPQGEDR